MVCRQRGKGKEQLADTFRSQATNSLASVAAYVASSRIRTFSAETRKKAQHVALFIVYMICVLVIFFQQMHGLDLDCPFSAFKPLPTNFSVDVDIRHRSNVEILLRVQMEIRTSFTLTIKYQGTFWMIDFRLIIEFRSLPLVLRARRPRNPKKSSNFGKEAPHTAMML